MSFIITFLVIIASIDSFWWLISRVCCLDPAQETKELGSVSRPWGRRGYSVPNLNLNLNLYSTPQQLQRPSSDELMNLRLRKVIERWTYWWIDSWVCLFVSETINFVSFCGRGGGGSDALHFGRFIDAIATFYQVVTLHSYQADGGSFYGLNSIRLRGKEKGGGWVGEAEKNSSRCHCVWLRTCIINRSGVIL